CARDYGSSYVRFAYW
nr:immunoglobulin heavy chain junction region [Mus musculus]MBK4186383.1 immunoglobulin heavy chain junction region [Mus musculus]